MQTLTESVCKTTEDIEILLFLKVEPITKTCLYNFDPLKPPFYIVKLGFTGVYVIFLIFEAVLTSTHNVLSRNMKNIRFFFI